MLGNKEFVYLIYNLKRSPAKNAFKTAAYPRYICENANSKMMMHPAPVHKILFVNIF